ncbi:tRNA 4-thiouridine(8) synthase ThiI [Methanobrevibacter sp. TMH8]|uniref:tRNA uracil 4-sulfurtransferase ThiI n=1 Tax=Methanobrevibacter sp. TMH8 TaxID=2848611 RepID=UPI001CCA6BAC|nr:tRNA uracil 4-sulfurtransferase ThiI [Methanobrevibacter sp. TMH8]MBZ9570195.1 tRNA 4-thiouridine(8) synthase ThiI [Methanobrevibacter sp. TMH8]
MNYNLIIARYGEIGIKSPRVRARFERKLKSNIESAFDCRINISQGRVFVFPNDFDEAYEKLKRIFGVVSFSPAICTVTSFEDIEKALSNYSDKLADEDLIDSDTPFAIRCRRVGNHDFSSQELAAFAGGVIIEKLGCPVDLSNPKLEIFVEVRDNETYIYHKKIKGPGGLPLGTQGRLVALISSGIDSPVAAYLMMKRGCSITAIHFDNDPFAGSKVTENFEKLVDKLNEYSYGSPIKTKIIKYGNYLKTCKENAPEKLTCVLCKSGMYRVASEVAKKENALGIVDGSSVGQVASQTLPNILATRDGAEFPILSPLIGLDKVEIEKIARKIGTFPISEIDDGGCSAVPRYPETKSDINRVHEAIESISQDEEIGKIIDEIY